MYKSYFKIDIYVLNHWGKTVKLRREKIHTVDNKAAVKLLSVVEAMSIFMTDQVETGIILVSCFVVT